MKKEDIRISILNYLTKKNGQTVIEISDFVNSNIYDNHYSEVPKIIQPMIKDELISGRLEILANKNSSFKEYRIFARITSKGTEFLRNYRKEKTEKYYYIAINIITLLCFVVSTYSIIQNNSLNKEVNTLKKKILLIEKNIKN